MTIFGFKLNGKKERINETKCECGGTFCKVGRLNECGDIDEVVYYGVYNSKCEKCGRYSNVDY